MRLIWRFLGVLVIVYLLKGLLITEPQAYIMRPEGNFWVQKVEWEVKQIQRAAQDLPASIEIVLRRLFRDVKPHIEAKSV